MWFPIIEQRKDPPEWHKELKKYENTWMQLVPSALGHRVAGAAESAGRKLPME
jgi:hypothetical protein